MMQWHATTRRTIRCLIILVGFGSSVVVEEQCRVMATMTDAWIDDNRDDEIRILLPKVRVEVLGALDEANFTNCFATRYGRRFSESPPLHYARGTNAWLANFAPGAIVPCFVDSVTPDDITLEPYEAPNEFLTWAEFVEERYHTLIVLLCVVLFAISLLVIFVVRHRDPGVDVRFPSVRTWCCRLYPWILLAGYLVAWLATMSIHSKKLQHKYFQPLLFGVFLLSALVYFYLICNPFCARVVSTNLSLVIGVPCYFCLFWTILFVSLVPKFNWLHEGHNIAYYTKLSLLTFNALTKSLFHITCIIIFLLYRERLLRAFGVEGELSLKAMWNDLVDPFFRRRTFIGIKVVLLDIVGKLPARYNATGTNNLIISVQCEGGEMVQTRVHNAQPGSTVDSKVYRFHEICQVNIPMDPLMPTPIYFRVLDQGAVSTEEVARVVISVAEVYEFFFSGTRDGRQNVDVELHVGDKISFAERSTGKPRTKLEQSAMPLELQFINFRGPAYLWLACLPANDDAEQYIKSLYSMSCCARLGRFFARRVSRNASGPEDLMGSSYEPLVKLMEMEATRPLSTGHPGSESYASLPQQSRADHQWEATDASNDPLLNASPNSSPRH